MEHVRFPLGTTEGNLTAFKDVLQSSFFFKWPCLSAYSSSLVSRTFFESEHHRFMRFGDGFSMSVNSCIFDEKELKLLRESMCTVTTSFGSFDENLFSEFIMNDRRVLRLLSCFDESTRSEMISIVLINTKKLLKTPGFFEFRYVYDSMSFVRVTSALNGTNSFSNVVDYVSYQIADVYMETYYVVPIERLYTGLFFSAFKDFMASILNIDRKTIAFHKDDFLSFVLSAMEPSRYQRDDKECLFLLQGVCKNKVLDKMTQNMNIFTIVKRNLVDCPDRFLSSRCKKQIRSALNFRIVHACLLARDHRFTSFEHYKMGGYNLSLITYPFANRYSDYYDLDCKHVDISLDLRTEVENHVFKMALLRWHVFTYENKHSVYDGTKETELVMESSTYIKEMNVFISSSPFAEKIGTVYLNSKIFVNIKKFLGLSSRGKKLLVIDLSFSKFVSKSATIENKT